MGMHNLTNHIIAVANKNQRTINNIQLQKILYFTLRYSVPLIGLENAKEIYDEPFLV
jgi:phage protein